ncbi:DUF6385 domain-containing protein [Thermotalea metallivorans]|uniref:DUF6385 domain-containing protein n=1 Tax=Thermotalea metallivorans TaxID=520762 RepID=A0A140L1I3_9FIRM|nr:DUF6385 domain-containing protein [Thermotalea metallivorans]KXG74408.1 hypothetical protein AN619_23910 [Thermotalea metallivorans]
MPNHLVFNNVAKELQTLINGVDGGGTARPILTDANGRLDLGTVTVTATNLDIRPLSGTTDSITVTATDFDIRPLSGATDSITVTAIDFDIRPLSGATDSITVTAIDFDIRPLSGATDSIQLSSRLFTESSTTIAGVTDSGAIFVQETGEQSMYSFYVYNTGSSTITVNLQISPTTASSYFVDDGSGAKAVAAGEKAVLVAQEFLRYTRLFYETGGATATFAVFYNAHV